MEIKVWYLYHSGFAVKIKNKLLIFDYYLDTPVIGTAVRSLSTGVINPHQLVDDDVYVFVSHRHGDHYQKCIYQWQETIPNITYILSDDIEMAGTTNIHKMGANQELNLPDFTVATLLSNDEGVAFLVKFTDLNIYHSGDLNWWHWQEEPEEWNSNIESIFKQELKHLEGIPIDIAFIPVDPRLESSYSRSLKYFSKHIADPNTYILPMHFADNYSVFDQLQNDQLLKNNILRISKRGQEFNLKIKR